MTILEFVNSVFGSVNADLDFIKYIVGGVLLLVLVDGVVSLLFGTLSNTVRGGR